jgi:simple sugar transport system substrate-binding protein
MMRYFMAAALCFVFAAAAGAETVGFAQVGTESSWRRAFTADMQAEAARRGITLLFSNADNDPQRQLEAVQGFIAAHVDAIVIAPVVETGWTDVLKAAQAAKIPVFIADRSVEADPALFVARIAADFNLEGRLAGAWLAQATRGTCNIVELQGTPGAAPTIERHKGFLAVISQFPNMHIVHSAVGNFTPQGGADAMRAFLRANAGMKDICAVWSHNDEMSLGAIGVMKQAGLRPGHDQLMVSVDGAAAPIFRAILAGDANMCVELKPDTGHFIFDVVQGYLAGRRDYPKWVLVPSDLHTIADAAEMLARRGS